LLRVRRGTTHANARCMGTLDGKKRISRQACRRSRSSRPIVRRYSRTLLYCCSFFAICSFRHILLAGHAGRVVCAVLFFSLSRSFVSLRVSKVTRLPDYKPIGLRDRGVHCHRATHEHHRPATKVCHLSSSHSSPRCFFRPLACIGMNIPAIIGLAASNLPYLICWHGVLAFMRHCNVLE
jgi:hypothetical protein